MPDKGAFLAISQPCQEGVSTFQQADWLASAAFMIIWPIDLVCSSSLSVVSMWMFNLKVCTDFSTVTLVINLSTKISLTYPNPSSSYIKDLYWYIIFIKESFFF